MTPLKYAHPEALPGEVFLTNATMVGFMEIQWTTKRRGNVAYDGDARPVMYYEKHDFRPVFVRIDELVSAKKQSSVTLTGDDMLVKTNISISAEELRSKLEHLFPVNTKHWGEATDEVRDLCRYARETLELDDEYAVDFRVLKTPSAWNTVGINGIIRFYKLMTDDQKASYVANYHEFWADR